MTATISTGEDKNAQIKNIPFDYLSSHGPKPLAPKPKKTKPRGLGLTLKSHGPPAFRVDKFSAGRTKCRSPVLKRTWWNILALFLIGNLQGVLKP